MHHQFRVPIKRSFSMTTEHIETATTKPVGKSERAHSATTGGATTQAQGITDQVGNALQSGYNRATDSLATALNDAPAALTKAAKQARKQIRRGNAEIKRQLGNDGPLYLLAGAIGLVTLGIFALRRR
jgi:hypothetical protein